MPARIAQTDGSTVLLLEPDDTLASALCDAFDSHVLDWHVDVAKTVNEAADSIATCPPSLLLCSASVHGGDTADLVSSAGEITPFPLVLMIDATGDSVTPPSSTPAGVFDHLLLNKDTLSDVPHRTSQILNHWALLGAQSDAATDLREKEEFNFALFQHNPSATVVVDHDGLVIKSNLARRAMEESLPELGAPLFDTEGSPTEQDLAIALKACIQRGVIRDFEEIQLGNQWYQLTMAPLPRGAIVLSNNITKRKEAEAAAEEHQKQLIHADKMVALGTLVSGVAHEVSNPNNAMILSSAALKRMVDDLFASLDVMVKDTDELDVGARSYEEMREELPEMINVVNRSAERIKTIVGDLKTYARRGSEALTETVDCNEVLDASVSLLSAIIRKSTNRFSLRKDEELPTIHGNAQQIEQVVINLITNACQALPGTDAAIRASTRVESHTGTVLIEVEDEGPGIPAELLDRVTEPFFTTKQDDGGTGLGLSISRTIIENHGGELRFASKPGKGTLATIRLPQQTGNSPRRE